MECVKDEIVCRVPHEARISKKKVVATTFKRVFNLGNRPRVLEDAGYLIDAWVTVTVVQQKQGYSRLHNCVNTRILFSWRDVT
jgi:hypothetical protein